MINEGSTAERMVTNRHSVTARLAQQGEVIGGTEKWLRVVVHRMPKGGRHIEGG